jgi:hypothetical protein
MLHRPIPAPIVVLAPIAWNVPVTNFSIDDIERDARDRGVAVIYSSDLTTMILHGRERDVLATIRELVDGGMLAGVTPGEA